MSNGAAYHVEISRQATRDLAKAPEHVRLRALRQIQALSANPRPRGCLKLTGYERRWRLRIGDWRIIYDIFDHELRVVIVRVPPRGEAYD
jgi:mRNA interferase RelE/StbE